MKAKTKTTAYWNQKGIAELVRMVIGDFCECVCVCVCEKKEQRAVTIYETLGYSDYGRNDTQGSCFSLLPNLPLFFNAWILYFLN